MTAVAPQPAEAPVCLADLRRAAEALLPPQVWDFVEGGAGAETTLAANRAGFDAVTLLPRVLAGVSSVDSSGTLAGTAAAMPVAVAPMAYQRLVHPDGELASARAAKQAGVPLVISTLSSCTLGDLAATGASTWFQLYWLRDRSRVIELLGAAEDAGCLAVVLTADVPIMGRRRRDVRNQFALPPDVQAVIIGVGGAQGGQAPTEAHLAASGASAVATHTNLAFEPGLTWRDVDWLRRRTHLPLVIKGILDPRDARHAADCGANAVVVSNHGGRQLDGAPASIAALPAVVDAVSADCEVLLDSGVRGGTDVLRALALGARGVLLGRPVLWGLAAGGEHGVASVLSLLQAELLEAMTLAGCPDLAAAAGLSAAPSPCQGSIGRSAC